MFWNKKETESDWNEDFNGYSAQYSEPFGLIDNFGENNIILTDRVQLSLNSKATRLNNNVLVVGSAGTGKSRHFIKPNVLQANCNYVITDPYGEIYKSTKTLLEKEGYKIHVLNLENIKESCTYNPFDYISSDEDVYNVASIIMKNTLLDCSQDYDIFFEKSEESLLLALMLYLIKYRPKDEHNFKNVIRLLEKADCNIADIENTSELDKMFQEIEVHDPTSIALKQYKIFKSSCGKLYKSIVISLSVRLTIFNLPSIQNLTKTTSFDLKNISNEKEVIFIRQSICDSSFRCISVLLISQLTDILQKNDINKRHTRFMIDEFGNSGYINEISKTLAIARRYNFSFSIIVQSISQIKKIYPNSWEYIIANCDSLLYLGGQDFVTMEYISKILGPISVRQTQQIKNTSNKKTDNCYRPRGVMETNEIAIMPQDECILIIRGLKPFKDKKFEYINHKNYKYTSDANK